MALLNFALTYSEVSDRLTLPEATSGQYVELVFTKDGHIVTHGTDFTPTFTAGKRGLVPGSNGQQNEFLRGNGKWLSVTTADLPIATSVSDAISSQTTNTTILSTQQIIEYVSSNMAASDAMVYKGTISYSGGTYTTHTVDGQDVEGFPTKCKVGDTYRVTSNGTYGGQVCSNGDLITCIKDGSGSSLNTAEYWTAIEANINGTTTHKINDTGYTVYTSNPGSSFSIFAPTTGGTAGQILISNGSTSAPSWVDQSTIASTPDISTVLTNSNTSTSNQSSVNPFFNLITTQGSNKTVVGSLQFVGSGYTTVSGAESVITISSSWRDITIGGTSIGDKKLNFLPTGDVYIKADSNGDDVQDLSFGISWYNLSTGQYEIA